ncbi:LacI family DNA-binding transcriptional regulator [Pedobacter alpinus]|uniref:LacI family DNA-binding transcriptional regulator n=1 Tax=Pedobacter alpinus TaxID=1590643 RepID=A0ABW5TS64_9SPHI
MMKKYKPITQKDIADALGLSISTVSRVLNNVYGIGDTTKKLVLDYAKETEYAPNPIALRLKKCRSFSIGVVVPEVASSYFSEVINGIESSAYRKGYHVIVTQTHESTRREMINIQQLVYQSIDGILVSLSSETVDISHFKALKEKGTPLVFFDRVPKDMDVTKIAVNNFQGAFEATEYLIRSGHKKIAHLTSCANLMITDERLNGYKAALSKYYVQFNANYFYCCESHGNVNFEVEKAVIHFMSLRERPEAILTVGDKVSVSCIKALNKFGFKIPHDISLVAFANITEADMFKTPLTTVSQPAFEIGKLAADKLIKQIEDKLACTEFETSILTTSFDRRSSAKLNLIR